MVVPGKPCRRTGQRPQHLYINQMSVVLHYGPFWVPNIVRHDHKQAPKGAPIEITTLIYPMTDCRGPSYDVSCIVTYLHPKGPNTYLAYTLTCRGTTAATGILLLPKCRLSVCATQAKHSEAVTPLTPQKKKTKPLNP